MSAPFKMKGITPLKHLIGKHPSKKDGHKRSDHKTIRAAKKLGKVTGKAAAEVVLSSMPGAYTEGQTEAYTEGQTEMIQRELSKKTKKTKKSKKKKE